MCACARLNALACDCSLGVFVIARAVVAGLVGAGACVVTRLGVGVAERPVAGLVGSARCETSGVEVLWRFVLLCLLLCGGLRGFLF